MKTAVAKTVKLLSSRRFYLIILAIFIFESVWIAFSAHYPQAFDENFHFGLIQVYSHYWLPFLSHQPPNANAYGAVARDSSYLYHYLMSFPYRILAHFVHGQVGQVILLRLLDIGFFTAGLVLFRRVFMRAGVSQSLTNTILLLFVLIPIVPQLAAQVNYDDMLFPLVAAVCLLAFRAIDELRQRRPSARTLLTLAIVCVLASLVKYAFLPIFVGVVVFLAAIAYQNFRGNLRGLWAQFLKSLRSQSLLTKIALPALLLVSIGMFVQRDGINLVKYHAIEPDCGQVLNVQACSAYSPWYYNYTNRQLVASKPSLVSKNPFYFVGSWFYWMWYRLFFSVDGPTNAFTNYPPLPLPCAAAAIVGIAGAIAIVHWRRRLFHNNPYLVFLLIVSVFYAITLFIQGYITYRQTAVPENMNGRYLVPILLLFAVLAGRALSIALYKSPVRKTAMAVLVVILFLQGGGLLTFIARSDQTWDWQNSAVVKANNAARAVTRHVVITGEKTYGSRIWLFN